jgi:hypothetical protein
LEKLSAYPNRERLGGTINITADESGQVPSLKLNKEYVFQVSCVFLPHEKTHILLG